MTPLERTIVMLQAAPEDPARFSAVLERLCDAEVFLALEAEASDENVTPKTVERGGQSYVAIFDTELRLAEAVGRALVQMLVGQDTGIALNPGASAIGYLFERETLDWLARSLDERPNEMDQRIAEITAPPALSPKALEALSVKLTAAQGLAEFACLVQARDASGLKNPLICFVGKFPAAQADLAKLIQEYLQFSQLEAAPWDVSYLLPDHPMVAQFVKIGLRFDLPMPEAAPERPAPGSTPGQPPILR
jgi:hypothetical protein